MRFIETIYNGERYMIPQDEMVSWFAYVRDLSIFEYDCGHLEIAFTDKFNRYKKKNQKSIHNN